MGLYWINCTNCGGVHQWFSGSLDQRCKICRVNSAANSVMPRYNGEPLEGTLKESGTSVWVKDRWHQMYPRPMVESDIYHVEPSVYHRIGRVEVSVPFQYAVKVDAGPRRTSLTRANKDSEEMSTYHSATDGPIPLSFKGRHLMQRLRYSIEAGIRHGSWHVFGEALSRNRAAIARRMGELESERFTHCEELHKRISELAARCQKYETERGIYGWKTASALQQRVNELENETKVNAEFIELQSQRLKNARAHVARIRSTCDVNEFGDSGASLDP